MKKMIPVSSSMMKGINEVYKREIIGGLYDYKTAAVELFWMGFNEKIVLRENQKKMKKIDAACSQLLLSFPTAYPDKYELILAALDLLQGRLAASMP